MPIPTASETLIDARAARARGDVDGCLRLSVLAMDKAKQQGDTVTEFWACIAPGVMHLGRGEPHEAAGYFRFALDTALRRGLTGLLGAAYHDNYLAARDAGELHEAKRFRAVAFEIYRDTDARNPRIAGLMADWAEEGMMYRPSEETAAFALQSWRACPASLPGPKERLVAACNLVVASAWLRLWPRYRDGMLSLETSLADLADDENVSIALSHACTGVVRMKDYQRAIRLAESAVRIAGARGEHVAEQRAREVLGVALAESAW